MQFSVSLVWFRDRFTKLFTIWQEKAASYRFGLAAKSDFIPAYIAISVSVPWKTANKRFYQVKLFFYQVNHFWFQMIVRISQLRILCTKLNIVIWDFLSHLTRNTRLQCPQKRLCSDYVGLSNLNRRFINPDLKIDILFPRWKHSCSTFKIFIKQRIVINFSFMKSLKCSEANSWLNLLIWYDRIILCSFALFAKTLKHRFAFSSNIYKRPNMVFVALLLCMWILRHFKSGLK